MTKSVPYNIHFDKIERSLNAFLRINSFSKVAVLVDENTKQHCYSKVVGFLPEHTLIEIKSGEVNKTLDTAVQIWQEMTNAEFDRKALLINLGGGVIGDMGGFCAATYKRGISFVQVPTTLLSQVDASVGGKLGIDFQGFKNHIGMFEHPQAVFIDVEFLKTLQPREFNSGVAEIIKHALIKDEIHFDYLVQTTTEFNVEAVVERSVNIKKSFVEEDFKESGVRKALNFGHTIGHAIESELLGTEREILHGEAVAAGMICECHIALQRGLIKEDVLERTIHLINQFFNHVEIETNEFSSLIARMLQDKKNSDGKINCTLLTAIGQFEIDQWVSVDEIEKALKNYQTLEK